MAGAAGPARVPDSDTATLVGARALHLVACAVLLGSLVVRGWVARDAAPAALAWLVRAAVVAVVLSGVLWLLPQAADMADGGALDPALGDVLAQTRFGHALLIRIGCALAVLPAGTIDPRGGARRARFATPVAAFGVATLAWTGHGAAADDAALTAALVAHVLAASAWLGGLPGLLLVLWEDAVQAGAAARRFSWLGLGSVLVLVAGAVVQAPLVGAAPALVGTPYGRVVAVKIALLLALLGLAAANWRASMRLAAGARPVLRGLRRRIWLEVLLGAAAFTAAATLLQLAPGAHQPPEWPFPLRPSAAVLAEPALRREVAGAVLALLASGGVCWVAARRRPPWLPALPVGAAVSLWAAPSLGLLLVPASHTSYYLSPTGFAAASVLHGAALYPGHCAACHGADGRGADPVRRAYGEAADLMASHLWDHTDGELFGWIADGIAEPEGRAAMPGFAGVLDETEIWALIDFVRARNAGLVLPADPAHVERQICGLRLRQRTGSGGRHAHIT